MWFLTSTEEWQTLNPLAVPALCRVLSLAVITWLTTKHNFRTRRIRCQGLGYFRILRDFRSFAIFVWWEQNRETFFLLVYDSANPSRSLTPLLTSSFLLVPLLSVFSSSFVFSSCSSSSIFSYPPTSTKTFLLSRFPIFLLPSSPLYPRSLSNTPPHSHFSHLPPPSVSISTSSSFFISFSSPSPSFHLIFIVFPSSLFSFFSFAPPLLFPPSLSHLLPIFLFPMSFSFSYSYFSITSFAPSIPL